MEVQCAKILGLLCHFELPHSHSLANSVLQKFEQLDKTLDFQSKLGLVPAYCLFIAELIMSADV